MDAIEYNLKNRVRKVDTSKLSPEAAESIAQQINVKVVETGDRIIAELNNFLKIYGLTAKVQVALEELKAKGE